MLNSNWRRRIARRTGCLEESVGQDPSASRARRNPRNASKPRRRLSNLAGNLEHLEVRNLLAANVLINEIMFHPASNSPDDEYIELFNQGNQTANLKDWQFTNGVTYKFGDLSLAAGQHLVIAANLASFSAKYPGVTNVVGPWTGTLSDSGEKLTLANAAGTAIDSVSYADAGDWANRVKGALDRGHTGWDWQSTADGLGKSLELVNAGLTNDNGQNWLPSLPDGGTPGVANSTKSTNVAPLISAFNHAPNIPRSTDAVTISAKLTDELTGGNAPTATLFWRVDGAPAFTQASMLDDGLHGDGTAGDGVYGASIPPQADLTVVEFYVQATDKTGQSRTWPAPTHGVGPTPQQLTNALYQVDNSYDPLAPWVAGSQPQVRLVMTDAERKELSDIGADVGGAANSNAMMNATFITNDGTSDNIRYNVGVRNRGHGSRFGPPNNYHVEIPHDNAWKGVTTVTLNCRNTQIQILGSAIFRMADLAAGDASPTQLRVNGAIKTPSPAVNNTYALVDEPDNDFVNKHFADDPGGNLYSGYRLDNNSQRADFRYEGPDPGPYQDTYFKQNNQAANDWSDLIHLTDVIANTPDANFFQEVSKVLDVKQWMRYLALNSLLNNLESGFLTGVGDDYAIYRGVNDTRFKLVPHDLDTLFQGGGSINTNIFNYTGVFGLNKLLSNAEILPLYFQAYIDLIGSVFNHTALDPLIDQAVGSFVAPATVAGYKQFVTDRTAAVLAQIPRAFSIVSSLPVQGGYPRTANASTTLTGQGDVVTTRSILVNGQPTTWNPRTGAWSSASFALNPGLNRVVVEAFDGANGTGKLVNSSFIDIWRDPGTVITPGANFSTPFGTVWRYLDDGTDQGLAWRGEGFVDSTWKNGIGQIGWGDADEATTIAVANQGFKTYYFRQTFTIPAGQAAKFTTAAIDLIYDDGARVYLNNTEIFRGNLPGVLGDETVNAATQASSNRGAGVENAIVTQAFNAGLLHDGVNTIAVELHQFDTATDLGLDLRLRAREVANDPQPPLIAAGSMWRYLDTGVEPAATWKSLGPGPGVPNFDDGAWKAGRAQLGYSSNPPEGDEATVVGFGPDANNKYVTTWFRKTFTLLAGEAGAIGAASITLTVDDGAAVYLNGVEVIRENLPGALGDNTLTAGTLATVANDNFTKTYTINAGLLRDGINVLAVEVHQNAVNDDDLSFDLQLLTLPTGGAGGNATNLSGAIAVNTTLTAAGGPYRVVGDVTVPVGVTLTIEPGTTLYFDQDRQLIVNGRLVAEGTRYNHIRFSRLPGTTAVWGGIQFKNTLQDNRLTYADLEWGGTANNMGMVGLDASNLTIDHSYFDHAERRRIRSQNSSLIVRDSYFNDIFAPGVAPSTDNLSEHIWGGFIPANGRWIIERNYFGLAKGHNDMIDFDAGTRPGAVPQIRFNVFAGGGDDAMDLEGDAHIEGNLIYNMVKDQWNTGVGNSNGMSLGAGHHYVVERNTFVHNQHVAQVKDNSFLTFVNNTVIDSNFLDPVTSEQLGAIYFIRQGVSYGKGAYLDGNIFADTPLPLDKIGPAVDVVVNRSIVPAAFVNRGVGNSTEDPRLRNKTLAALDVSLRPGSPAIGAGPNGADMGSSVPPGATISGEPPANTSKTSATLFVGGPDTWAYKYRVNGGVWSAPVVVTNPALKNQSIPPIQLNGLADGTYMVEVVRQNSAFEWQADADATKSKSWTVKADLSRLVLNEILAENLGVVQNGASHPDAIELYNGGANAVDLSGMSLTDDPAAPTRFVFAPGTTIPAGGYLVVFADSATGEPGIHAGFAIDGKGETLYLYDAASRGGALLDSVAFGNQAPNLSIGRVGQDAHWALTTPTFGAANAQQRTGDPASLKINEWFANGKMRLVDDFIELYNADPLPVNLAGLYVTDDPVALPKKNLIGPLTFVAGGGFGVLTADNLAPKPGHVNFKLGADGALLGLYDANAKLIDKLLYYSQTTDFSQGRSPDGAVPYAYFGLPTPGLPNSAAADPKMLALLANLRVTELMYNSVGGSDFEYIELTNIGAAPLDITGVRIAKGVDYTFPAMNLAAGQRVVVVANKAAFQSRYGNTALVAGEYLGSLSDGGEPIDLKLPDPFDAAIQRFTYSDKWYPTTDGQGYSLDVVDAASSILNWDKKQGWKASAASGGSPGLGDPVAPISFVVTNTNDSGPGSLRQAMLDVEAAPLGYQHVVSFNIGGASPYAIQLQSNLPNLTQPVTIDVALGKEIDVGIASAFSFGELPALSKVGGGQLALGGNQTHAQPTRVNVIAGALDLRSDLSGNVSLFGSGNTANILINASQHLAAFDLRSAAKAILATGGVALQTKSLTIDVASGASLDLVDGALIVDYTGGASPANTIENYLRSGINVAGVIWDGPGLRSSTARDDVKFVSSLGMIDNANVGYVSRQGTRFRFTADGEALPADSVLVKFTYAGDADLNGVVDGDDLVSFLVGYSAKAGRWDQGDFDFSGLADGDDLTTLLYGYLNQGAPLAVGLPLAPPKASSISEQGDPAGVDALANAALADAALSDWSHHDSADGAVGVWSRRRRSMGV